MNEWMNKAKGDGLELCPCSSLSFYALHESFDRYPNLLVIELFETENVLLIYLIYLLIYPANRQTYWSVCTLIRKIPLY